MQCGQYLFAPEKYIYKKKELDKLSTTEIFSVVQIEGKREVARDMKDWIEKLNANTSMILPVNYTEVNSHE